MNQSVEKLDAARNQELYMEPVKSGQNEQVRRGACLRRRREQHLLV